MTKFLKSRVIQAAIISAIVILVVAIINIFYTSTKDHVNITATSSNIAIGNHGPVTQVINPNPFPPPSFSYSVGFLNATTTGLPLTPPESPYKSSFYAMISHAPATNITGSIIWEQNLFSSCELYSGWSQEVDNNGMLKTSGDMICFSKKPLQDDGKLFKYTP